MRFRDRVRVTNKPTCRSRLLGFVTASLGCPPLAHVAQWAPELIASFSGRF